MKVTTGVFGCSRPFTVSTHGKTDLFVSAVPLKRPSVFGWSCYGSSQARAKKLNTFIISTIFPCHVAIKLSLNRVLYVLIWLSPFFSPLWLQLKDFKSHMSCFIINNTTVRLQCFCKHSGFISSLSFKCCADKRGCLVF